MSVTDIKGGDRVRITFEGEADEHLAGIAYGTHDGYRDFEVCSTEGDKVTIEKIEPPVEVFKPGDVVRDKDKPDWLYLLTHNGYSEVGTGAHYEDGRPTLFTSRYFERVSLP